MKRVVIGIEKRIKLVKTEPRKGHVKRFNRKIAEGLQKLKKQPFSKRPTQWIHHE
jgi:hypothetical protein